MKTLLVLAFVVVLCHVVLSAKPPPKDLGGKVGGRGAGANADGAIELRGKRKSCSVGVVGYVEKNTNGNEIEATRNEVRTKVTNKDVTEETLPFSDGISAKCLAVTQELGGTNVELKCCVAKEAGNVTLGADEDEELPVEKGYLKCSISVSNHTWSSGGEKLCILANVVPPGQVKSQACVKNPGNSGKSKRKLPKKCDLGDDATLELSTMVGEIPSGGTLDNISWTALADDDVGIFKRQGKLMGSFCLPKGDEGSTTWYDPTMGINEDGEYDPSSATRMTVTLFSTFAAVLASVFLY